MYNNTIFATLHLLGIPRFLSFLACLSTVLLLTVLYYPFGGQETAPWILPDRHVVFDISFSDSDVSFVSIGQVGDNKETSSEILEGYWLNSKFWVFLW